MKTKILFLFTSLIYFTSFGQIGFEEKVIIDNTNAANGAESTFAADLDGDGDMDVLSASYFDDKIAWYENLDGQGNFGSQHVITTNVNAAVSVHAADLDGDGDMDVLSASFDDDKIAWYENLDGQGNFGIQQIITIDADWAYSVFTADLDDDGDMDVLSASRFDDKIAWYENIDGQGQFSSQQIITTTADGALSVFAVDMDDDGDVDVLSASSNDDKIAWYENMDGQGNFGVPQIITSNADGAYSVYGADLDGDGDIDVLSASFDDNKVAWYENIDGQGSFSAQQIISINAIEAKSAFAADLDGDGDMDVLSASRSDDKIAWYENMDGQGSFSAQQIITINADGAEMVFATDLDGDSDMDVLSASRSDDKIAWYENMDGQGSFGIEQIITTNADGAVSVYAIDIDGDGDMDVLSALWDDNKIAWYENLDGQGNFGSQQIISANAKNAGSVYATDLDGDDDVDILFASAHDNKIAWYENIDGQGNFGAPQQIITTNADDARFVYAADLDGDSDMDVLSASGSDNKIAWYENMDGQGSFGVEQTITTEVIGARSVYAADLNADDNIDVVSVSSIDGKIAWYKNIDGDGNFILQQIITTNSYGARSGFTVDLDNDGDMDVLAAFLNDGKIAWFENEDGQGSFGIEQTITTEAEGARSVYAVDLDDDGDMDVLSASFDDDKIAWYENEDGQGNFGVQQIISINADGASSVFAIDMNGNGKIDVLSASYLDDKIAWYENSGTSPIFQYNQSHFSIYPIPTSGILKIESKTVIDRIEIFNQLGQLVAANSHQNQIDISNLNNGFYFCKIKNEHGVFGIKKVAKK